MCSSSECCAQCTDQTTPTCQPSQPGEHNIVRRSTNHALFAAPRVVVAVFPTASITSRVPIKSDQIRPAAWLFGCTRPATDAPVFLWLDCRPTVHQKRAANEPPTPIVLRGAKRNGRASARTHARTHEHTHEHTHTHARTSARTSGRPTAQLVALTPSTCHMQTPPTARTHNSMC